MNDLVGLPQAAEMVGISRQAFWVLYRTGRIQAAAIIGTPLRPRPLFRRSDVEVLIAAKAA